MAATLVLEKNGILENDSKELFLYPVDLPFDSMVQRVNKGGIILDPDFQREYKWNNLRASALIESCLMRIPLPVCYFWENEQRKSVVIDGVQRLTSIKNFIENKFALEGLSIYKELNGLKFHQLPYLTQGDILNYTIRCIVLRKNNNPEIVREIFARLNSGGVLLSQQETRHALNPGPLLDLLRFLATWLKDFGQDFLPMLWELEDIKSINISENTEDELGVDSTQNNKSYVFNRHKQAEEFVLRFFALKDLNNYETLKKHLDVFLSEHNDIDETGVADLLNEYKNTFNKCRQLFGDNAFSNFSNTKKRKGLVYYDLQMWGLSSLDAIFIEKNKEKLIEAYVKLCNDSEFSKTLSGGTARKDSIEKRRILWDFYFKPVLNA